MIKKLKYTLIVIPIILSILLIVNIIKYYNSFNKNENIIQNDNNFQERAKENNDKKEQLITELNNKKDEKKDEIWEYNRWKKWNQEIKEKIN